MTVKLPTPLKISYSNSIEKLFEALLGAARRDYIVHTTVYELHRVHLIEKQLCNNLPW